MRDAFLIKYGELAIKGKNRYLFENALLNQIKKKIKTLGNFDVKKEQGRLFVEDLDGTSDQEEVLGALTQVFGIVGVCPVKVIESDAWESIQTGVVDFMKDTYGENVRATFKVQARRANKKYPMNSMEIACELGGHLLDHFPNLKVDVHKPEIRVNVELRNHVYVYSEVVKGAGGMPVGTNGKAMLLLSGGIDSPVAGWMIAKRGVAIDAVYYHSHPYTSDRAKQKVIDLAQKISAYTGDINLHIVPFTDIQLHMYEVCPQDQLTIIMRRIMMQIAEKIAVREGAMALVTGEAIGQVASQTIQSLSCTNAVCNIPVFRPLIGFDKQEIVDISEKIDTYETSILPYEDCCTIFVAKHPVTRPKIEYIERSEKKLEDIEGKMAEAIANTEVIRIKAE